MKRAAALRWLALAALLCALPASAGTPGEVVRVVHRDPEALPSRGPADAPVTIELFFTPGPRCRVPAYLALERLQAEHPTRIRLVYRILAGNGTAQLPYAALEAAAEGKFFAWMAALDAAHTTPTREQLVELGKRVGLDPGRLLRAITDPPPAYREVLARNERRRRQRFEGRGALPAALFDGAPSKPALAAMSARALEEAYLHALDVARDLLDRGAPASSLAEACAGEDRPLDIAVQPGATDEELDDVPAIPPLATPPLALAGLPSYGPPTAAVTIAVLCSPTSANCRAPLAAARVVQDVYPRAIRVVWAPFFDVTRDDAADLSLLADAALCAERVGTSSDDDLGATSAGWSWMVRMREEARARHRHVDPQRLIDELAGTLEVDRKAFATCRAQLAGTSIGWIEAARHAGVRETPATVIDGRIYPSITDPHVLQQLVERVLSPPECAGCLHLGEYAPAWRRGL